MTLYFRKIFWDKMSSPFMFKKIVTFLTQLGARAIHSSFTPS